MGHILDRYVIRLVRSALVLQSDAGAAMREMDPAGSALVEAFMESLFPGGGV